MRKVSLYCMKMYVCQLLVAACEQGLGERRIKKKGESPCLRACSSHAQLTIAIQGTCCCSNRITLSLAEFTCSLENDLLSIQDKDLRELLIKFCTINIEGVRSKADRIAAQERAIRLHSYGDLVELLCEPLGRNQLKATFEELETLYFKPIDVYIDNQYKGKSVDFRRALKAYGE